MLIAEWYRRKSLLKCVLQPEIAKNSLKTPIFDFKVVQGHRCWYHRKAHCTLYRPVQTASGLQVLHGVTADSLRHSGPSSAHAWPLHLRDSKISCKSFTYDSVYFRCYDLLQCSQDWTARDWDLDWDYERPKLESRELHLWYSLNVSVYGDVYYKKSELMLMRRATASV